MVLVSNPHRFIFLKTSKTASTTVEMALESACVPPGHTVVEKVETLISEYGILGSRLLPCKLPEQPCLERGTWCNHKSAAHVLRDLGEERFNAYTKITTVRNPFDKCVSAYHWLNNSQVTKVWTFGSLRRGFQNFLKGDEWKNDAQNVYVDDTFIIDRVIRFEHMARDLKRLSDDLGIPVNLNAIPHTKSTAKTRKKHAVADYYDQESIDIVRERLSWVFEKYDYPDYPLTA